MAHENLQLCINLTKIKEALKADPKKGFKTERGDLVVTVFCETRKAESANGDTHSLHMGRIGTEKIYVGKAKLSKYQPNMDTNREITSKSIDEEIPF